MRSSEDTLAANSAEKVRTFLEFSDSSNATRILLIMSIQYLLALMVNIECDVCPRMPVMGGDEEKSIGLGLSSGCSLTYVISSL